jgi:hypothetical protein
MKQPTKPNTNKNKDIVTIGDEWTGEEKPSYICDSCHCSLVRLSDRNNQNESWYCNRCSIEYPDVTNIRHQLKITVPDRNIEPAVTSIQINMADEVEIRHTPPLRGGFAELQKKGLKIKNYHTTEKE